MSEEIGLLIQEMRAIKEALQSSARDEEKLEKALDEAVEKADQSKHVVDPLAGLPTSDEAADIREVIHAKAVDDKARRLQELNDDLYTMKAFGLSWKGSKTHREFERVKAAMAVANTGYGAEYDPTSYSSQVIEAVEQRRQLAGIVQNITMPRSPFAYPTMGASGLPYLVGEATTDTAEKIPSAAVGTSTTTFTAKTLAVRFPFSMQLDEDSIVAMRPALTNKLAQYLTNGVETAIVNGDTTGAAAGTYSTATDPRLSWNGLRYLALQSTATTVDSSTFAEAAVQSIMGKISAGYADDPNDMVWLTSSKITIKLLSTTAFPGFVTIDKIGNLAANIKGFVGMLYGSPVVKSAYVPETLDANGKDAASSYGALLYFNKNAYALATNMSPTISVIWDPETLQYRIVGHWRGDFQAWLAQGTTTNRAVAMGVKITP